MELILFILVLILVDLAAMLWGADSRDGPNSPEWERRQSWYGFH